MRMHEAANFEASVTILDRICRIAHPTQNFSRSGSLFASSNLKHALEQNNNPAVYNWLMTVFSYQGVADKAVETILARDGNATWDVIDASVRGKTSCSKLRGFWTFAGCGFSKFHRSCNCQSEFSECVLPRLHLRNGSLNQLAFSLYFFFRDVAGGSFLDWLGERISVVSGGSYPDIQRELISPMRAIHGISDKVISMALSDLLLASPDKPHWRQVGAEFIVVDRLIHNFLHRSGILQRQGCQHVYGSACYGESGCAKLLLSLSRAIDMRRYHHTFPQPFPRFVQTAIWRYCAASGENICNGNQIDDSRRCRNKLCNLQSFCSRIALRPGMKRQ